MNETEIPALLALVINLDSSQDRWQHMQDQLEPFDLVYERVPAVLGKALSKTELDAIQAREADKRNCLDAGTIGCFLSHRRAWEQFLKSDRRFALVLEDDMFVAEGFNAILSSGIWKKYENTVLKLETFGQPAQFSFDAIEKTGDYTFHSLKSTHFGCGAYLISRTIAQQLLSETEQFQLPVDHYVFRLPPICLQDVDRIQCIPAPFVQSKVAGNSSRVLGSIIDESRNQHAPKAQVFLRRQMRSVRKRVMKLKGLMGKIRKTTITQKVKFG